MLSLLYVKSSCAVYKLTKTNGIVIGNARGIRRKDNSCLLQYHTEKTWDKEREKKPFRHNCSFPNKLRNFISSHCSCKETCPVPPPPEEKNRKACCSSIMMTSLKVQALTLSVIDRPSKCAVIISRLLHTVQLTVWFTEMSLYCKFAAFQFAPINKYSPLHRKAAQMTWLGIVV